MSERRTVDDFDELVSLLQGLSDQLVEAGIFLPQDDGGWATASFSGTIKEVVLRPTMTEPPRDKWEVIWSDDSMTPPSITLWPARFRYAELTFSGDIGDGIPEPGEAEGQNSFLKIYTEGLIIDLVGYL